MEDGMEGGRDLCGRPISSPLRRFSHGYFTLSHLLSRCFYFTANDFISQEVSVNIENKNSRREIKNISSLSLNDYKF